MKKVLFTAVAAAAVVIAAGPAWTGSQARQFVDDQVNYLNELPGYSASVESYDQGWFGATASVKLEMDRELVAQMAGGNQDLPNGVLVDVDVAHGPVLVNDGFRLGWSSAKGTLNLSGYPGAVEFSEKVGVDSFMTMDAITTLSGAVDSHMEMPNFEFAENGKSVSFGGLTADMTYTNGDRRMVSTGEMGELTFSDQQMTMKMSPMTFESDVEFVNAMVQLGKSSFNIKGLEVNKNDSNSGEPEVNIAGLGLMVEMLKDGDDTVSVAVAYSADSVQVPEQPLISDAIFHMSLKKVGMAVLDKYYEMSMDGTFTNAANGSYQAQQAMSQAGEELGQMYLKNSPEIEFNDLSFKYGDEQFKADMNMAINGESIGDGPINPMMLVGQVTANANINVTEALAKQMMAMTVQQQMGARMGGMQPEDMKAQIDSQVDMMLSMQVAQGMLLKDDSGYSAKIDFTQGALTVNGKAIPLM